MNSWSTDSKIEQKKVRWAENVNLKDSVKNVQWFVIGYELFSYVFFQKMCSWVNTKAVKHAGFYAVV